MHKEFQFKINSNINPSALALAFRKNGRLHVPEFLDPQGANALFDYLMEEADWSYFLFSNGHIWEVPPEKRRTYTAEQENGLFELAHSAGRKGYGFLYETNRLSSHDAEGVLQRAQPEALLKDLVAFLNSSNFVEVIRKITGAEKIDWVEATATRFQKGHFLAFHDDSCASSRRIAYVINLTREWRAEWGGLLEFMNSSGHIAEAYVPRFNSLNIFRVPMAHAVSCVSPSAGQPRLAISGWLHRR